MNIHENKIEINGSTVSYLEYKPVTYDHTLLCTHGNSSSANAYEALFQLLNKNTRLISLSFNGHGESDVPENNSCSIKEYISSLVSFISILGLEEYTIVGHSIGGHVAIESVPFLDENLEGLICICSPPFNQETISEAFTDPSDGNVFKGVLNETEVDLLTNCFIDPIHLSVVELDKLKHNIFNTNEIVRPGIGKSIISGDYYDEVSIINNITVPVCFIQGEHDKFINEKYYYKYVNNKLCPIRIVTDSCHYPHIENPVAVADIINNYLDVRLNVATI